jgi:hypothetical protein
LKQEEDKDLDRVPVIKNKEDLKADFGFINQPKNVFILENLEENKR